MPVTFGVIWLTDPSIVFLIGAGIALASLSLAFLVPRHPDEGRETVLTPPREAGRAGGIGERSASAKRPRFLPSRVVPHWRPPRREGDATA